jgi:hypothetical protein
MIRPRFAGVGRMAPASFGGRIKHVAIGIGVRPRMLAGIVATLLAVPPQGRSYSSPRRWISS